MVGNGIHAYPNKGQVSRLDLLENQLSALAVVCLFALLDLKFRLRWF